jgi:FMN phosphatase YigB (HAD superfamily)
MALGAFIMTVATHVYICTRANLVPPLGTGKPHPDIFLEAARRIGCEPCNCRAYEDGESGLCAAYAARHIHFRSPTHFSIQNWQVSPRGAGTARGCT